MYQSLTVLWMVTLRPVLGHVTNVTILILDLDIGVTNFQLPKPSQRFTYLPAEMVGIH